jgi:hypothetical protein
MKAGPKTIESSYKSKSYRGLISRLVLLTLQLSLFSQASNESFADDVAAADKKKPSSLSNWIESIQGLDAEAQTAAVTIKLEERNEGFDGKLTPKIENGVVTEVLFLSTRVKDIAPLQAFRKLRAIRMNGEKSPFRDFSPVRGMPLTKIVCVGTSVSDLTPLIGMPLRVLNISGTQVSDLTPLQSMPLTYLLCDGTKVNDLSPLYACQKLETLVLGNLKVTAAAVARLQSALPKCEIKWAGSEKAKPVVNSKKPSVDPMLLPWLNEIADFEADRKVQSVAGKLVELNPEFTASLIPQVRQGVVRQLRFSADHLQNLAPLTAFSELELLNCRAEQSPLESLQPLRGMRLKFLIVDGTSISDLSPLAGMPLTYLGISRTRVSNLAPLRGMPLEILNCNSLTVTDWSPLQNCKKLKELSLIGTPVSKEQIAELRKALPDCKFHLK